VNFNNTVVAHRPEPSTVCSNNAFAVARPVAFQVNCGTLHTLVFPKDNCPFELEVQHEKVSPRNLDVRGFGICAAERFGASQPLSTPSPSWAHFLAEAPR
jgi:hypothetical protein